MVELIDTGRYPFDEEASGLCEPDASCIAFEQENAKVFLQRPYPRADAGLAGAERLGPPVEAEIFGNSKGLD